MVLKRTLSGRTLRRFCERLSFDRFLLPTRFFLGVAWAKGRSIVALYFTPAEGNPILGTWKLQSLVYEVRATGQRSSPFGDHPDGYLSYSADGRMYAIGVVEDRPKPRDLVATDEEKVELQGSMFAYAGTYTADGEKVVHHVDISWNQSWTGTDLVRLYKLDGNTLTITADRA